MTKRTRPLRSIDLKPAKTTNQSPSFEGAEEVSQYLLDRTGQALMSGDFDTFLSCFLLPQELHTFEGSQVAETAEDVRRIFDNVRAHFSANNVTELVRNCVEAEFRGPRTVAATHVSRPMAGAAMSQDPYPVFSILKFTDGMWQIAHSEYAIVGEKAHSKALSGDTPSKP